jgi:hypothetical protein
MKLAPPRGTPLWVHVTLLNATIGSLVACGSHPNRMNNPPPTCGPCCHDPTGPQCQMQQQPPTPPPDAPAADGPPGDAP